MGPMTQGGTDLRFHVKEFLELSRGRLRNYLRSDSKPEPVAMMKFPPEFCYYALVSLQDA
ncbi:MAG: hypothetical protein DMG47_17950 [Acidobacteria bacterium]|nr:MAG: hypothetical protein DMG47_17950 [Acidobacteriota bacterium]